MPSERSEAQGSADTGASRANADAAPRIGESNLPLGHIFEWWSDKEAEHRAALKEACDRAANRERNYDQPWWAANVRALLLYVEQCEEALRAR